MTAVFPTFLPAVVIKQSSIFVLHAAWLSVLNRLKSNTKTCQLIIQHWQRFKHWWCNLMSDFRSTPCAAGPLSCQI